VKILGWQVPFTGKATDQNTVTPIRDTLRIPSRFGFITEAFGGMWQRNLVIDDRQSLIGISAVYACLSLRSGDIAKLRILLKKKAVSGIWEEAESASFSPVLREPNRFQTAIQFVEFWILSKLIWGNTYVLKERDERNVVTGMYILDPQRVTPLVAPDGEIFYRLNADHLAGMELEQTVPASEIIHDRAKCMFHPLVGIPPLYASALSGTHGRKIQQNAAKFFENMSRPSGILTAPDFINDETAARLKREYESNFSGENIGRLMVAGNGIGYQGLSLPADQSQLIEQTRWTVEDVARAFQVPLYKIGAGPVPAFSSVAALNQEYYQQALQLDIEAIEALLDRGLGLQKLGLGVEFDLDGLLRMDPKTRAETHEILVRSAIYAPNDARKLWDLKPAKGGDSPMIQQQNFSLEALAKRDAKEDPFATEKPAPAPAANDDKSEESAEAVRAFLDRIRKGLECLNS
jgi:HK97 family phage portal protein